MEVDEKMGKVNITKGNSESNTLRLYNGDLVVIDNQTVYMVASFTETNAKGNAKYCTLINLETGIRAFSEPSSRDTTMGRLISHLEKVHYQLTPNRIEMIRKNKYTLNINVVEEV